MDSGGFVLNIATASSGSSARPAKKKNSFRAKQAAKRAKFKAKGSTKQPPPPPTQQRPARPSAPTTAAAKATARSSVSSEREKTAARGSDNVPAATAHTESSDPVAADDRSRFDSDSESDTSPPPPVPTPAVCDDSEDDFVATKDATESASEASESDAAPASTTKSFGTRRNPNKELYDPASFTTVRAKVVDTTTTLDRPRASAASEKIFAAKTFASLELHPRLVHVLTTGFGFERPTTVQVQSIPAVLSGKDVLVKSETGSGKTLSYLLPIVHTLQAHEPRVKRDDGCLALILAPTRELCLQILETANKLVQPFVYLVPGAIIGGEKKKAEKARLRKGLSLLIATPGRLADHLVNTQAFQYAQLQFLVLDEADRLLDMGFEKQIKQILSIIDRTRNDDSDGDRATPSARRRQNVLVSATVNTGVEELAKMSLKHPLVVDADGADSVAATRTPSAHESFSTPHQLMQHFMIVPAKARLVALTCFLRQELAHHPTAQPSKVVVFMSTCDAVDFHYGLFRKTAWPAGRKPPVRTETETTATLTPSDVSHSLFGATGAVFRLHGNIPQHERMAAFKTFCAAPSGVLLCTDVAARGLNLPTVQWIVQYDPPTETRDYVHRVGRTARSGKQGSSLLFLMPSEAAYLDHLQQHGLTMAALSTEKTLTRVGKHGGFMRSNKKLPHEVVQSDLQFLYDQTVLADKELFALACQAFHSFVRSYATHTSDTRAIFHVRSLHFGHIAKSFALREPPASSKVRDSGRNAKKGTLQKRKDRDEKEKQLEQHRAKKQRQHQRTRAQNVSEFAD